MINWQVRIHNKQFWVSVIPALALVVQAVAAVFGWALDFTSLIRHNLFPSFPLHETVQAFRH